MLHPFASVIWSVADFPCSSINYPLHEFSEAEKIMDTNANQNLLWSICSGMMVAISATVACA